MIAKKKSGGKSSIKLPLLCLYLDGTMHVRLFDAQHNLPGNSDAIEEVVDETHIVYEGINVTGAQHQQSGDQLNVMRSGESKAFFTWRNSIMLCSLVL